MGDAVAIGRLAAEAFEWFETATRPNGEDYVRRSDGAPEWVADLVYAAHGGDSAYLLPDDYRYAFIRDALEALADADGYMDAAAEGLPETVYTSELLAWVGSSARRIAISDAVAEDLGIRGIFNTLQSGERAERLEVLTLVHSFLWERSEG